MRRMILGLVLLSLPVGVQAGSHRAGAGGGGGGAWKSFVGGFIGTFELTLMHGPESSPGLHDWTFSLVTDYTRLSGDHNGDLTQQTWVGGLRYTRNFTPHFQPYVHGQLGGYWEEAVRAGGTAVASSPTSVTSSSTRETSLAGLLGVGADLPIKKFTTGIEIVIRGQADYYWTEKDSPSYPQVTGLFVVRFP